MPVLVGHVPDSISIKELTHYGQGILSSKYFKYHMNNNFNSFNSKFVKKNTVIVVFNVYLLLYVCISELKIYFL